MTADNTASLDEQQRTRLQYLKEYFEEEERRFLAGEQRNESAHDEGLFDEYMQLHWKYGERRPRGESGLVVYYRKLLRLPVDAEE